mgnify:CR=1 FL=1
MIRVVIVDDHYIVREGIRMVLELEEQFDVIGEAENGLEALQLLESVQADVVLLDLNMPQLDGVSFLRKVKQSGLDVPCIVLTTYKDEHLLVESVKLGVRSYLLKDAGREVIYETIQRVVNGETWFPREIEELLQTSLHKQSDGISLTSKEVTILKALAAGKKNSEIAEQLFVSERTVKSYLTVIYEKLQVKSRAQAIAVAIEKKYL